MPQVNVFQWRSGAGWLVVSGGGAWESESVSSVEAAMLTHTHSLAPIAYIWAASDLETADQHMESLAELGARTGFLIDILAEEEESLRRQLAEAGVIILGDGPRQETLRGALAGVVWQTIEEAFARGATVYAEGASAALLGAYVIEGRALVKGFNWLAQSIILPGYTPDAAPRLRHAVQQHPETFGLGLGAGAAMAFGPNGEVEVWGDSSAITISLGQRFESHPDGSERK